MKPFDDNGAFKPPTEGGGLRHIGIRSAGVTVFAQGLRFVVQMIATVVVARLLVPENFGVIAMFTAFSVLLVSFAQIGFPDVVLQRDKIEHFLTSDLFRMNVGALLLLTIGFAAAEPLLVRS